MTVNIVDTLLSWEIHRQEKNDLLREKRSSDAAAAASVGSKRASSGDFGTVDHQDKRPKQTKTDEVQSASEMETNYDKAE